MNSLKKKTVKAVVWSIAGNGMQLVIQFLLFVVLARTLRPEQFGTVAMATAIIDILMIIGRGGLVEVLTRYERIDDNDLSTAFWLSAAYGIIIGIGLFVLAPSIASLYAVPELKGIVEALSATPLVYAIGAAYEGQLRRSFGFKVLAIRNVTASTLSGILALAFAVAGAGAYSLVIQRLAQSLWVLIAMIVTTNWWPRRRPSLSVARLQASSGAAITLSSILGTSNQRVIDLAVGLVLGPVQLGYLRIAWRALELLNQITIQPISVVALSAFAAIRDDRERMRTGYNQLVRFTAIMTYPVYMGAAALAPFLIPIVFGEKWAGSIDAMRILALTGLFSPLFYYNGPALVASGYNKLMLGVIAGEFIISIVCTLVLARYGLTYAAAGNVLRTALIAPISMLVMRSVYSVSFRSTLGAVAPSLSASLGMGAIVVWLTYELRGGPSLPHLTIEVFTGIISYTVLVFLFDRNSLEMARKFVTRDGAGFYTKMRL